MERTEHVHIISAGEKIASAYPAMFRELPGISRTIVFTDSIVHEGASDPVTDKDRLAVRNAYSAVQEISASLSIPFTRELIFPPAYVSVRTALAKIRRDTRMPASPSISRAGQRNSAWRSLPSHPGLAGRCMRHSMRSPHARSPCRTAPSVPCLPIPTTSRSSRFFLTGR